MTSALLDWLPGLRFLIPRARPAGPFLFDDVVGNINGPFRFAVIGEVDPLVFSHQADVATLFPVTETGHSNKANRAKQQASPKPREAVMPFVLGCGSAIDDARYPDKEQRNERAHY